MTEKEKAKELIEKFRPLVTTWDCYNDSPQEERFILADAKKCALLAVEEIIELPVYWDNTKDAEPEGSQEYWQKVKEEIKNL